MKCRKDGVRLVKVPWAEPGSRFTLMFEALAIAVLKEASVNGATHLPGLSWDEARAAGGPRQPPPDLAATAGPASSPVVSSSV